MKSVLAASALLALAGSSQAAFTLISLGIGPNESVSASSGSIRFDENTTVTYYGASVYTPAWSGGQLMVTGVGATWGASRAAINNSSWFAIDPKGPNGFYSIGVPNGAQNRPLWNNDPSVAVVSPFTDALRIGGPVLVGASDGNDLISSVGGGAAGFAYAPQRLAGNVNGAAGNGCNSDISGNTGDAALNLIENIFVGRFTLTDVNAVLAGNLLITLGGVGDPAGFNLNLDGTPFNGVGLFQVRSGNSINVFVAEIPAPGALAALGLAGLAATRRRR